MQFDVVTMAVLVGTVYGPIAAWQAAGQPARPGNQTSVAIRVLLVGVLIGSVAALVVLVVIGRPQLAALLVASSVLSYLLATHRRRRDEHQPAPTE